jgi:hypothetical protein
MDNELKTRLKTKKGTMHDWQQDFVLELHKTEAHKTYSLPITIDSQHFDKEIDSNTVVIGTLISHIINYDKFECHIPPLDYGEYFLLITEHGNHSDLRSFACQNFTITDIVAMQESCDTISNSIGFYNRKSGKKLNAKNVEINKLDEERSRVTLGSDKFYTFNVEKNKKNTTAEKEKIILFTDRKIYRPGDLVYVKGIIYNDLMESKKQVIANKEVKLSISRHIREKENIITLISDEYGAFSYEYKIPKSSKTGRYFVTAKYNSHSRYGEYEMISIEEYKAPKFSINFLPVNDLCNNDSKYIVKGHVQTLSGYPLKNAKIKYSVHTYNRRLRKFDSIEVDTTSDDTGFFELKVIGSGKITVTDEKGETQTFNKVIEESKFKYYLNVYFSMDNFDLKNYGYNFFASSYSRASKTDLMEENNPKLNISLKNFDSQSVKNEVIVEFSQITELKNKFPITNNTSLYPNKKLTELFPHRAILKKNDFKLIKKYTVDGDLQIDLSELSLPEGEISVNITIEGEENKSYHIINYYSKDKSTRLKRPVYMYTSKETCTAGEEVELIVGSAFKDIYCNIFYEINGKRNHKEILLNSEEQVVRIKVPKDFSGFIPFSAFIMYKNESKETSSRIKIPFENKALRIKYTTFQDKLSPGSQYKHSLKILDRFNGVNAQVLCTMYDKALDTFAPNYWNKKVWLYRNKTFDVNNLSYLQSFNIEERKNESIPIDAFRNKYYDYYGAGVSIALCGNDSESPSFSGKNKSLNLSNNLQTPIFLRSNFNDTAFFIPTLETDENGNTEYTFKTTDDMTTWVLQTFAHSKDMKIGYDIREIEVSKDLIIEPNLPRFLRQNDQINLTAKIMGKQATDVNCTLQFYDIDTGKDISTKFEVVNPQTVSLTKKETGVVTWKLNIPDDMYAVRYKIMAKTETLADGEQDILPILSNRQLIIDTHRVNVRAKNKKDFQFINLLNSDKSKTLENVDLTVKMTSNSAWEALFSLPYVMEYPHECNEQQFSKLYAILLTRHLVNSNPVVKQVVDSWSKNNNDILKFPLARDENLKMTLKREVPWYIDRFSEINRISSLSNLLRKNEIENEIKNLLKKIKENQNSDGSWSWWEKRSGNVYVTSTILTGINQLEKLGIISPNNLNELLEIRDEAEKYMFNYLENIKYEHNYLSASNFIHNLYSLSNHSTFVNMIRNKKFIMDKLNYEIILSDTNRNYTKAQLALVLYRFGRTKKAKEILMKLRKEAIHDETGMYWNEKFGRFWWNNEIETHAMLIEAFSEVLSDTISVHEMRVWLLNNKNKHHWRSTKSTIKVVYALLMGGESWVYDAKPVKMTLGNKFIDPENDEKIDVVSGTSSYKIKYANEEITPDMGNITVENPNKTPAHGGIYWSYIDDIDKISTTDQGIHIMRQIFVHRIRNKNLELEPISDTHLKVGDKVTVKLRIDADEDYDYIHIKDSRCSAFEPTDIFTNNSWKYYKATYDSSTNFFVNHLAKGSHSFSYDAFITHTGEFLSGITYAECMYAPENKAILKGEKIIVK